MANSRQNNDYIELRDAIRRKDRVRAQKLILNNVSVNNSRLKCNTPLHWAIIQFQDLDIMKMLVNKGANIHAKNHSNLKPLEVAIQNGKTEAALFLISKGALVGEDLNTVLIKVMEKNYHDIMKSVIDYGIQYNTSINFNILFNTAVSRGYTRTLNHILPHYQFLQPSDKYIPREFVIKSGKEYKKYVELLLKWNFIIDPTSSQDNDFVYGAVENGYLQIVLELLKLGIDVNLVNSKTGFNLLKIACLNRHREIVENLLKHNASVNDTSPTNYEILSNSSNFCWDFPRLSDCNQKDIRGLTCLHIAVLNSDPVMTRLLLKYGAKIIDDPKFFKITCIAVKINCEEIVRIFLDRGVNVNDVDDQGKSLLHFCVDKNYRDRFNLNYKIAKLLLKRGAITHIQTPGNTLFFEAVQNTQWQIARLFLDNNADIQYINLDGDTALHKAIEKDSSEEFIETLLKLNFSVNAVNNYMSTPLHFACKLKSDMTVSIIELLLEHNANIEAVDNKGWTPFFIACASNNYEVVKCLLDHQANVHHTDLENLTSLYIAAKYCRYHTEVVKILLEHKVNVHCIDKQGNSIIHRIVENRNAELIESLARTQVNFNSINKEGNTPLHIAVKIKCYVDVIENLIKYGANINVLDKKNRTSLHNVIENLSDDENELEDDPNCRDSYWNCTYSSDNVNHDKYDRDYCERDIHRRKDIIKILKTQVVKLKTAGLMVNKQNLKIVYNPDDYVYSGDEFVDDIDDSCSPPQLEEECEQEIEKMKAENIGVNKMTLYDLLNKNIHLLSRYVLNKKIQRKLDLEVYDENFPLYIDIVRSRFRDAKLRYRLMNSAKKYFSIYLRPRMHDYCIDTVFSYLNIKAIKMFIRAMKPLGS